MDWKFWIVDALLPIVSAPAAAYFMVDEIKRGRGHIIWRYVKVAAWGWLAVQSSLQVVGMVAVSVIFLGAYALALMGFIQ